MAGTILTNIGLSKLAAATPQNQLNITHIAVGDGNGGFPTLSPTMTALTNEVWRSDASNPIKDSANTNYVYFETNIPPEVGPFDVREIACFDAEGDMIAIGHTSLIQKPDPVDDASFAVAVKIFIALENESDFDLIYQNTEVTSHNALSDRNVTDAHNASSISTKTTENTQDFIDSFALKIFQSPTDGLTEINTRTLTGGEVYEVRKVSDDSLATIYSDKEDLNPIVQNGTSNVSGNDGVIEFCIADGDSYYVLVNSIKSEFFAGDLSSAIFYGETIQDYIGKVVITEDGNKCQVIACVIRNTGSGWSFIDDVDHRPIGFSGISVNVDGTIRLNHSPNCTHVGSLLIVPDEAFAKLGIIAGSSVGTTFSNVTLTAPLSFYVDAANGTVTAPPHFGNNISASVASGDCVITHPSLASGDSPSVTPVGSAGDHPRITVAFGTTETTLKVVGNVGGYVNYNGSSWVYTGENANDPTFSWNAGTLLITHEKCTQTIANVSARGANRYNIDSLSSTTMEVEVRDSAGALITTENTDMKFFFDRPASVLHSAGLDGVFSVNRGQAFVNANDLVSGGGNLWVIGLMKIS